MWTPEPQFPCRSIAAFYQCVQITWHTFKILHQYYYDYDYYYYVRICWIWFGLLHVLKDMQISAQAADARAQSPASERIRSVCSPMLFNVGHFIFIHYGPERGCHICLYNNLPMWAIKNVPLYFWPWIPYFLMDFYTFVSTEIGINTLPFTYLAFLNQLMTS